MLMKCGTA